jgi:hypothetical protein
MWSLRGSVDDARALAYLTCHNVAWVFVNMIRIPIFSPSHYKCLQRELLAVDGKLPTGLSTGC